MNKQLNWNAPTTILRSLDPSILARLFDITCGFNDFSKDSDGRKCTILKRVFTQLCRTAGPAEELLASLSSAKRGLKNGRLKSGCIDKYAVRTSGTTFSLEMSVNYNNYAKC